MYLLIHFTDYNPAILLYVKWGKIIQGIAVGSSSMERGWELMWLATGCFAPSTNLLKEVTSFLRSYPLEVIATDCIGRLQKILRFFLFSCIYLCLLPPPTRQRLLWSFFLSVSRITEKVMSWFHWKLGFMIGPNNGWKIKLCLNMKVSAILLVNCAI